MHKYRQRVKRTYSDEFRAKALTMLEAEGYPDNEGSITKVSRALRVPLTTLYDWQVKDSNLVSSDIRAAQSADIRQIIRSEMDAILEQMKVKRADASYRDLGIVYGILHDKLTILEGNPTHRTEHVIVFSEQDKASVIQGYLDIAAQRKSGGMPPSDPLISDAAHRGMVDGVSTPPPPPQQGTSVPTDSSTLTSHGDVMDTTVVNHDLHKLSDDAP